jgi:hypothetical protein
MRDARLASVHGNRVLYLFLFLVVAPSRLTRSTARGLKVLLHPDRSLAGSGWRLEAGLAERRGGRLSSARETSARRAGCGTTLCSIDLAKVREEVHVVIRPGTIASIGGLGRYQPVKVAVWPKRKVVKPRLFDQSVFKLRHAIEPMPVLF